MGKYTNNHKINRVCRDKNIGADDDDNGDIEDYYDEDDDDDDDNRNNGDDLSAKDDKSVMIITKSDFLALFYLPRQELKWKNTKS